VHEEYDPEMIRFLRLKFPGVKVLSHPECNPGIIKVSDYVGSTSQMLDYVGKSKDDKFAMLTECGLSSRLQIEYPEKQIVGSCTMCKYMKSNTLEGILRVLLKPQPTDEVVIDEDVRQRAQRCIDAMFEYVERPAVTSPAAAMPS
jgi:quinolinate synthase